MSVELVRAFARQADADLLAWERYEEHPQAVAAECHRLLFLQMACEKLCKAFLIRQGTEPAALLTSHGYVARPLPLIIKYLVTARTPRPRGMGGVLALVRHLAAEIELLNPAVARDGRRPDNCEYPWLDAQGNVHSPLDWEFTPTRLCTRPAGRTFLKLLRLAVRDLMRP